MTFDSEGLFSGLVVNAIGVPVILAAAWVLLQKRKMGAVELWKIYRPQRPQDPPTFFNYGGLGPSRTTFLSSTDPWLEDLQGDEANVYLQFLRSCMLAFGCIAFFSLSVILPVNATSDYRKHFFEEDVKSNDTDYTPGIADWTTRNVEPESAKLWAHLVISVIVAIEVYSLVINLMVTVRRRKAAPHMLNQSRVAMVRGLQPGAQIKLPEEVRDKVVEVYTPKRGPKGMLSLMKKYESLVGELQHWYAYCEYHGIHDYDTNPKLLVRDGCCGKVNAFEKVRERLREVEDRLEKCMEEVRAYPTAAVGDEAIKVQGSSEILTGAAFIVFKTPHDCMSFVLSENSSHPMLSVVGRRTVWFAPPASLVLWANQGEGGLRRLCRLLATVVVFLFLLISWSGIVAFLGSVDHLAHWIPGFRTILHAHPFIRGTLTAYMPIIALALLNLLLPYIMRWWTEHIEIVPDKLEREHRVLNKMFWFGLLTAVLMQAALQGFSDSAAWISSAESGEIVYMLVGVIAPRNGYFVLKVMQAAFIGNIIKVIRLGDLLLCPLLAMRAYTSREHEYAYEKYPFYFSEEYAFALVIFGFGVIFAVNVPIIPLFAFFYFLTKYIVDRSSLADCAPPSRPTDLRLVPTACQCALACLTISQVMGMLAIALAKSRYDVAGVSAVPIALSVYLHFWVYRETRYLLGPGFISDIVSGRLQKDRLVVSGWSLLMWLVGQEHRTPPSTASSEEGGKGMLQKISEISTLLPSLGPSHKYEKVEDFDDQHPDLDYRHPCTTFTFQDLRHEKMVSQEWLHRIPPEARSFDIVPSLPVLPSLVGKPKDASDKPSDDPPPPPPPLQEGDTIESC